jgi:hypothetical protein
VVFDEGFERSVSLGQIDEFHIDRFDQFGEFRLRFLPGQLSAGAERFRPTPCVGVAPEADPDPLAATLPLLDAPFLKARATDPRLFV